MSPLRQILLQSRPFTKQAEEEEENPTQSIRRPVAPGISRGQQTRFAAKSPLLFLASKAFLGQTKEGAQKMLEEVASELEKDAARHGGGWDTDGGVQAYAMTPKALGISSGGGRLGGSAAFSDLVSQSMRPTLASGLMMGGSPAPSASGLIAAYRGVASGEGGVGWLPSPHPCPGFAQLGGPGPGEEDRGSAARA